MPTRSPAALRGGGACASRPTSRNEKINYKVREHSLAKVPVLLVVGKREAETPHGRAAPPRRQGARNPCARRGRR